MLFPYVSFAWHTKYLLDSQMTAPPQSVVFKMGSPLSVSDRCGVPHGTLLQNSVNLEFWTSCPPPLGSCFAGDFISEPFCFGLL